MFRAGKMLAIILVILALIMMARDGFCKAAAGQIEAGAYGTLVVPEKGNFDTTGGGGGYLRYYLTENIALEGAGEYAQWDFTTDVVGASGQITGDLDVIPIMATLLYAIDCNYNLNIYIGGGFTAMIIDGDATGTLTPGGNAKIEFDEALGGHVCAGLDWKMTDQVLFNIDAKYTWATSETSETVDTGTLTFDDIEMNNFTLRGGISYKF